MLRKPQNTLGSKLPTVVCILLIICIWEAVSASGLVPRFMLPSPFDVGHAFVDDFPTLMKHTSVTLIEAFVGLILGVIIGYGFAVLMDTFDVLYRAFYPLIVLTQTVPTVAIAPLLVLWFGYGMMPKVLLIIIVVFFPVTVGLLGGFRSVDSDSIRLMRTMKANRWQIFWHVKAPSALPHFFSSLRIAATYAVIGAVIAEWLGGFKGLGVYMTRVKKGFAFDRMFAVIILISVISLLMVLLINLIARRVLSYTRLESAD